MKSKIKPYKTKQELLVQEKKEKSLETKQRVDNQRMYDATWTKYSKAYRIANPFCVMCAKEGILNDEDIHVDHIIPLVERPDLKYDISNLQSCYRRHHGYKTYKETLGTKEQG